MRESKFIGALAAVTSAASLAWMVLALHGGLPPRVDSRTHAAIGQVLARQTLGLLKKDGRVIVITRDTTAFKSPATDIQLRALQKTLRQADVSIQSIHRLQVDPLRPVEVPPGDFTELIRAAGRGSVIVSLMGPPRLNEAQKKSLVEIQPSIVAFCSGSLPEIVDLKALFQQGLLHAAVVSGTRASTDASPIKAARESLAGGYIAVAADNLEALPALKASH
jgi:hypothetical protein